MSAGAPGRDRLSGDTLVKHEDAGFSPAYKTYGLALMTTVWAVSCVDRNLMMLLMQPIKQDLQLTDTQLGFLTGIAFAAFYATAGIGIARWADRGNRVTVTSLAIGSWSLTVMACVLVGSYVQLVFARIAAAVGEAGCNPPTYSLIGDYFPESAERARAMAIYMTAGPLASLGSFVLGGWLNDRYGWRMTFLLMSIPGLVLAAIVRLTLIEPRRQRSLAQADQVRPLPSMKQVLATLWHRQSLRHLSIALILLVTLAMGMAQWYAAFLMRSHGMRTSELGVWLGLVFGLGGMTGVLTGGYVAARWFANNEAAQMRLSAAAVASLVVFYVAFLTVPDQHQALIILVPLMVTIYFFTGPTYALMQRLVPDGMRATMMAVIMLLANLIGMGIGPQLVGVLSDALAPYAEIGRAHV